MKNNKVYILSFIIPFTIILITYIFLGIAPFGEKSILNSDMSNIFIDTITNVVSAIKNGDSIFYSWNLGMGQNLYPFSVQVIFDPLSILYFLFSNIYIQDIMFLIVIIKIGLAGLTCSIFLNNVYKKHSISIIIFSTCYALMSYNIAYTTILMWLNSVVMLPLILLGIDKLLESDTKYNNILLIISSSILILCESYTGYMAMLMSIVYFIYRSISIYDSKSINIFFSKLKKIFISYIFIVGISSISLIPWFLSLQNGAFTSTDKGLSPYLRYDLIDILSSMFIGAFDTNKPGGMLNLYTGVLVISLVFVYFFNKKVEFKEKLATFFVLVIMYISMCINTFYLVWHGFDNPDWFEGRFTFVVGLFILYISYKSFYDLENEDVGKMLFGLFFSLFLVNCIYRLEVTNIDSYDLLFNNIFIILYLTIFYLKKNKLLKFNNFNKIILFLVCIELFVNSNIVLNKFEKQEAYENRKLFVDFRNSLNSTINYIDKNDDSNEFFRIEKTFFRRENDASGIGYNGISHFTSLYNYHIHKFLNNVGMPFFEKVGRYENSTEVIDSLLGIKYILSVNDLYLNYDIYREIENLNIYGNKSINIFKNNNSMDLIVALNNNDVKQIKYNSSSIEYQNNIVKSLTGSSENYYEILNSVQVNYINCYKEVDNNGNIILIKQDNSKPSYVEFLINNNENKDLYFNFGLFEGDCGIDTNFDIVNTFYGNILDKNIRIPKNIRDIIIKLNINSDIVKLENDKLYYFNSDDFSKDIQTLNSRYKLDIHFNNSNNINFKLEDSILGNEYIFTTIPFDSSWDIKINGKSIKYDKVLDAFIGFDIPQNIKLDEINVEMNYIPKGFVLGTSITIIFTLIFIFDKRNILISEKN